MRAVFSIRRVFWRRTALASVAAAALAITGPALAQTGIAPNAPSDKGPTVTVINKGASSAETPAPQQFDVLPGAGTHAAAAQAAGGAAAQPDKPAGPVGTAGAEPATPAPPPPLPTLSIDIDLTRQLMTVSERGVPLHTWQISSARYGYRTPTGSFQPTWMTKMWYSRQYDLAPMPHAIFFHKGVAIHGTYATRALGNPASHGCVRLALGNAATLFKLVSHHGKERTEIVVHGTPDHSTAGRVASYGRQASEDVVQFRRASPYRYLPPSAYGRGDVAYRYGTTRRAYAAPRYAPRGLYNGYSFGYGF